MFKIVGAHVPPPAGVPLAAGVGHRRPARRSCSAGGAQRRRRHAATSCSATARAEDFFDTFRRYYGPTLKAFGSLDESAAAAFEAELLDLAKVHNTSTNGSLRIPSEYLEVVAVTAG